MIEDLRNFPTLGMPQDMLCDFLEQSSKVSVEAVKKIENFESQKVDIRKKLISCGQIKKDTEITTGVESPTVCGIDGSHKTAKMFWSSVVGVCAVASEGLRLPTQTLRWENPQHKMFLHETPFFSELDKYVTGLMIAYELEMARQVPHDVVLLDFSLQVPAVTFGEIIPNTNNTKAVSIVNEFEGLRKKVEDFYLNEILKSRNQTSNLFVGVPKSTSKKPILEEILPANYEQFGNERAIMSLVLEAGEYTKPKEVKIEKLDIYYKPYFIYYKPHGYQPAFLLEMNEKAASMHESKKENLAKILLGIKNQTKIGGIYEPLPLYFADKMARSMNSLLEFVNDDIVRTFVETQIMNSKLLMSLIRPHRTKRQNNYYEF